MAKKKSAAASSPVAATLDDLLAAGDYRAARAEAARLEQAPGGEEAARAVRPRLGPERGAAVAFILGALLLLAIAVLGLRH